MSVRKAAQDTQNSSPIRDGMAPQPAAGGDALVSTHTTVPEVDRREDTAGFTQLEILQGQLCKANNAPFIDQYGPTFSKPVKNRSCETYHPIKNNLEATAEAKKNWVRYVPGIS